MKAAVASHYGGPEAETIQDIPEPALLPGTARVAVRAARVSSARQAEYGLLCRES